MNVYSLLPTIALLLNLFVSVYILAQKRNSRVNRAYLYYSFNLSFWIFCEIIVRQNIPSEYITQTFKYASIFWMALGFWFLNFSYEFLDKEKDKFFFAIIIFLFISVAVSLLTDLVVEGYDLFYWGPDERIGVLFLPLLSLTNLIPIAYGLYLIASKSKNTKNLLIKKSAPLIIIGTVISILSAFISNVLLPHFIGIRDSFQFAESSSVIQSLFIFIAVFKYRLFGLGIEDISYNLFNSMRDGVIVTDNTYNVLHLNESAEELFHIGLVDVKYESIDLIINNISRLEENERKEQVLNYGNIIVLVTKNKIKQLDENFGFLFYIKDITLRKKAEVELIEKESTVSELFEASPDALIVIDNNGVITKTNKQVKKILGYEPEELIDKSINELVPNKYHKSHLEYMSSFQANPIRREMGVDLELFAINKNGTEFRVDVMLSPLTTNHNKMTLATVRDISKRKLSEQKLKESEENYKSLVMHHPHGIVETLFDGTITLANHAYAHLYELEIEEMIGKKAWEIHTDQEFINRIKGFLELSKNGTLEPDTQITKRKNNSGKEFEIQIDWNYKFDLLGNKIGHVTVITDITKVKQIEKNFHKYRMMLTQSEQLAHLGSWHWNKENGVLFWSDELIRIYGEDTKTFVPTYEEYIKRLHAKDKDKIIRDNELAISAGVSFSHIERIIRPSGEVRILLTHGIAEKNKEGKVVGLFGSSLDITDYKNIENKLTQQRIMLENAEKVAKLGSWKWNKITNEIFWSDGLIEIYGEDIESFKPTYKRFIEKIHPDDREKVLQLAKSALKNKAPYVNEEKIIRKDGEVRILAVNGIPQKNENGELVGFLGSSLDITEFKNVERELRISQTQLRALSSKLQSTREEERLKIAREIHDELGQVLTAINMDIGLMIDELDVQGGIDKETLYENLHSMEVLIEKLIKSVQDISTELRPDVLDHLGLIPALEWQLKEFEKRFKIKTSIDYSIEELEFVDQKKIGIFRIFQEALTNVARHANATEVKIILNKTDSLFEMKIIDNGVGISRKSLEDIKSIGLIGIKERVLLLGGSIVIKRANEGGTEIHLEVPIINFSKI